MPRGHWKKKARTRNLRPHHAVLAVFILVIAILVPMVAAFWADGVNGMVLGGADRKFTLNSIDDLQGNVPMVVGAYSATSASPAYITHETATQTWPEEKQSVFTSNVLDQPYNEIIVSYETATQDSTRAATLMIDVGLSADDVINKGIVNITIGLSTNTDKTLKSTAPATVTEITSGMASRYLQFVGTDGTTVKAIAPSFHMTCNETYGYESGGSVYFNLTSVMHNYTFSLAQTDVLQAANYLNGMTLQGMVFAIATSGNTDATSIIQGDQIMFTVDAYGKTVNGYALNEVMLGACGALMIVLAIFATPFVNVGGRMTGRR